MEAGAALRTNCGAPRGATVLDTQGHSRLTDRDTVMSHLGEFPASTHRVRIGVYDRYGHRSTVRPLWA